MLLGGFVTGRHGAAWAGQPLLEGRALLGGGQQDGNNPFGRSHTTAAEA